MIGCRGSIGTVHVSEPNSYINGNAMALDDLDTSRCLPSYLARFLRRRGFGDVVSGSSQPQLTRGGLANVLVPLPPLDEQRRIAAILDQADAIRAKRKMSMAGFSTFAESLFESMFGPHSFDRVPLGSVASTTSGATPSRRKPEYWRGGIPWVKSGELHQTLVSSTEESITELALNECSVKLLEPGTVLLAMYGATAGAVSELGIQATSNQAVCAIVPERQLNKTYLIAALKNQTRNLLARVAGGAQPNLSQATIRRFEIPLPPLALQQEFAAKVQKIEEQRRLVEAALERDNELFASLQERAFSGGL